MTQKKHKFALVHDWLTGLRGGELVLGNILDVIGKADIYTLFYKKGSVSREIEENPIYTSFLDRMPFAKTCYRHFLPLMPLAVEAIDITGYKYIISSSHCVAKGVIPHPEAVHICYIHTPMRYIWDQAYTYFTLNKAGIKSLIVNAVLNRLRQWDITSSNRVDYFIANSQFVKNRVKRYYKRDAVVINPPCDTEYFGNIVHKKAGHCLMVSALNQYKKVEIAVNCFNRSGRKLIIVGCGPLYKKLKGISKKNIEFYQRVDKSTLRELYQTASAFIQVSREDFGMAAVESQAALTPVAAFGEGGASETVQNGKTGILFYEQNEVSLKKALDLVEKMDIVKEKFVENADRFSKDNFKNRFRKFLIERGMV